MASEFDPTDFVDSDFKATQKMPYSSGPVSVTASESRAPSLEETDSRVTEMRQKLAELRQAQESLEREKAAVEELRRKQTEFGNGRTEMIESLTRGVGLLEESVFSRRRDAEQMDKSLADLKDALAKVQSIAENSWTAENYNVELTRALTIIENARMEWNSARMKFDVLNGPASSSSSGSPAAAPQTNLFERYTYGQLCRLGFAFTWPVAFVLVILGVLMLTRR